MARADIMLANPGMLPALCVLCSPGGSEKVMLLLVYVSDFVVAFTLREGEGNARLSREM